MYAAWNHDEKTKLPEPTLQEEFQSLILGILVCLSFPLRPSLWQSVILLVLTTIFFPLRVVAQIIQTPYEGLEFLAICILMPFVFILRTICHTLEIACHMVTFSFYLALILALFCPSLIVFAILPILAIPFLAIINAVMEVFVDTGNYLGPPLFCHHGEN